MDLCALASCLVADVKKFSRSYVYYTSNGSIWNIGTSIFALCSAWNMATYPARPMTGRDHHAAQRYARAIRGRMDRIGYRMGVHYDHRSDGALFPLSREAA